MKTSELITGISQDLEPQRPGVATRLLLAVLVGGAISAVLFAVELGVRPDAFAALQGWHYPVKVALAMTLAGLAFWASVRIAAPDSSPRAVALALGVAPLLLGLTVLYELLTVAPADWYARALGTNSTFCLRTIPLLSAAPLVAIIAALRAGAPRSPAVAGGIAGLLGGAIGAALYAMHCPDDSPLFVIIWYSLAIALVTAVGALTGRRLLRW